MFMYWTLFRYAVLLPSYSHRGDAVRSIERVEPLPDCQWIHTNDRILKEKTDRPASAKQHCSIKVVNPIVVLTDKGTSVAFTQKGKKKAKVCFYIALYLVTWTAQSTLHFTPWQTCSFRHQLDFSGKHSSHASITSEDYSFTFPPLSIVMYSFKQLSELGHYGENENAQTLNDSKGDSNPGPERLNLTFEVSSKHSKV